MSSAKGRQKVQHAYTRFLQRNTWAAMVSIKPELQGNAPDFSTMSVRKVWAFLDKVEQENGMDRKEIERRTQAL
jgi:hypothetical protein